MSEPTENEIERRTLDVLEALADHPDDAAFRSRILDGEHPAVVARVLRITAMALRKDAMPTSLEAVAPWLKMAPPERFGAFRFVSLIGRGGMGEVWLGQRDDGLYNQAVAIKLIQPHLQARAGVAFESERRMLARLEHPHVARLIDGGTTDDGRACLVMEYVDGMPLDMACAALPLAGRIALFRQVLDAVGYAHGRLIAHGDLKPGNMLVDRQGRARLLDFGISRLVTDDPEELRLTGAVTSGFASPARLAGEAPSISDDIFALGRLLDLIVGSERDADLAGIASKASAANEADRYATVSDLIADLDRRDAQRPVVARRRTAQYVARKFARRNWKLIAAGTSLLIASGYAGFNYLQTQRERLEASARFEDARGAAHYLLFPLYDALAERPRTLLLRRQVAATAQRYLDRLAGSRSTVTDVRLEAAQGLLRLSQIEGSPYLPNLGQPERAKPHLQAALEIAQRIDGEMAYRIAAQAELELANNADMVDEDDPAAERHLAAAGRWIGRIHSPDLLMVAQFYTISSTIAQWKGDAKRAVDCARRAQRLLAGDTSLLALLRKSNAAELEGDGVYFTDKIGSIAQYRLSMTYAQQAVDAHPTSYAARRRLAITHYDVGTMLTLFGSPGDGFKLLQQAADEDRVLMQFEPDDDNLKRSFNIVERARLIALAANGHVEDALAGMVVLVADIRRIWVARPNEYRRMRDYAVFEMGLADQQLKYNRVVEACASYARSRAIFAEMGRAGHLSAVDRKTQLGGIIAAQAKNCHAG